MRDHMMGWVMPAEPLGPAIRPLQAASKTQNEASLKEFAMLSFEQGDHMLPGMKQKDFPKEYDTAVAIEDRSMAAYERAMRELALHTDRVMLGYDAGAPEGDRTVYFNGDWGVGMPTLEKRAKNATATATEVMLKMQAPQRTIRELWNDGALWLLCSK